MKKVYAYLSGFFMLSTAIFGFYACSSDGDGSINPPVPYVHKPQTTVDYMPENFDSVISELKDKGVQFIDEVTEQMEIPAKLLNYNLATKVPLGMYGLDMADAVHIPVQVSTRSGGRSSIYYIKKGETVMTGIFVSGDVIIRRFISRLTGISDVAKSGDRYAERLLDSNGNVLFSGEGTLEIIDFSIGEGILKYDKMSKSAPKTRAAGKSVSVWILWSCVDVEVSQAKAMDPKLEAAVEAFQNNGQDVVYDFKEETEAVNELTK